MSPALGFRGIPYRDFIQRVRAHRPSDLLPELARVSAHQAEQSLSGRDWKARPYLNLYPWIIAVIARESIAYGNEHRDKPVTEEALAKLADTFMEVRDPFFTDSTSGLQDWAVRTAYEQFPWNQPLYNELAHVVAMLDRDLAPLQLKVVTSATWEALLGADLVELVGASFLFGASTWRNDGRFDLGWLDQSNFGDVLAELPKDRVIELWQLFSEPFATMRAQARAERNAVEALRRLDWNPLQAAPYVGMPDGTWLAPQAMYVQRRASLSTIYYAGLKKSGTAFAEDLGVILEAYVGEQAQLLRPTVILGDVEYASGRNAVDYVVVLNAVVLLIEVKSARVALPARQGLEPLLSDVQLDVGKAFNQITASDKLIAQGHPAFTQVPPDLPRRGVVVTLEPHHLINSSTIRDRMAVPAIPTIVMSLGEFEEAIEECVAKPGNLWIDVTDSAGRSEAVGETLQAYRRAWSGVQRPRNPILAAAWARLPFK